VPFLFVVLIFPTERAPATALLAMHFGMVVVNPPYALLAGCHVINRITLARSSTFRHGGPTRGVPLSAYFGGEGEGGGVLLLSLLGGLASTLLYAKVLARCDLEALNPEP
jgi:hypothetical protein